MKRILLTISLFFSACVPKTEYDDRQDELAQTQAELDATKEQSITCDANTIMQLREQAQSLDLLSQELIERNTRVSKEVARLKVFEGIANNAAQVCEDRRFITVRR